MSDLAGLPSTRWSLRGLDDEGNEAWLIRNISQKLYRCPGCHGEIEIGSEHVVVQYVMRLGGTEHHHWHRRCAEELLVPELRRVNRVPANESSRSKLEAQGPQAGRPSTAPLRWTPRLTTRGAYAEIWRLYCSWAPGLLLVGLIVFVPVGLLHALAVTVEDGAIEFGSFAEILGTRGRPASSSRSPACSARSSTPERSRR